MAPRKPQERVFYAVLPDQGTKVEWRLADERTAYGLPPNAYLDLGGGEPSVWVMVVCRGRGCTVAVEEVRYEEFYDVAPPASHPRRFQISRKDSVVIGKPWENARFEATQKQDRERYRIWRSGVAACVSSGACEARPVAAEGAGDIDGEAGGRG